MTASLELTWRNLAPGWRWVVWGVGAGIAGGPLVWEVAASGWPSLDGALDSLFLGLPLLVIYLLLLLCPKRGGEVLLLLCICGPVAGLWLPGFH